LKYIFLENLRLGRRSKARTSLFTLSCGMMLCLENAYEDLYAKIVFPSCDARNNKGGEKESYSKILLRRSFQFIDDPSPDELPDPSLLICHALSFLWVQYTTMLISNQNDYSLGQA
jgi:hypothetical protein